jgi:hypothetical protein
VVVAVEQDVAPGQTSPEGRQIWLAAPLWLGEQQMWLAAVQVAPIWVAGSQTWLAVVLAEPVWLAVQQISPEVARALLEQQLAPVDYDSAGRLPQSVAAPEQGERESLGQLVFRQQSA